MKTSQKSPRIASISGSQCRLFFPPSAAADHSLSLSGKLTALLATLYLG